MSREELIIIANKIINLDTANETEEEELLELFGKHVPAPNFVDYFFQSEREDLTAEETVEKALSYKPIQL